MEPTYIAELEIDYAEFRQRSAFHRCEFADATQDEVYAFAGRMRRFLPHQSHYLVGRFAEDLLHRVGRRGMPLADFEQILIDTNSEAV